MSSPLPLFTGEKFKITTLHKKISIDKSNYTSLVISWCPLMASLTFSQNSSFIRKHKILVGHAYRFNNNNTDKNKYCTSFLHWGWRSYVIICSVCHSVCLSVCLSVCVQHYCRSNQPISRKLAVMLRPTNGNNWLRFGGDLVLDTDSRSLFHFPHHCGIKDLRRFVSISHKVIGRISQHLANWLLSIR